MPSSLVVENTKPGVTVLTNQSQVARPVERQPTSTAFIVGYTPWGRTNVPIIVTSWLEYVRECGAFDSNSYVDDFCYTFFNYFGGKQVVISRVIGIDAGKANLTLVDRFGAGIPYSTLRVEAKYPSTRAIIYVDVAAGTQANTVKLTVRCPFLHMIEPFDNVTLTQLALDNVNERSRLIKLTNLNSPTIPPNDLPAIGTFTLTDGFDDSDNVNNEALVGTYDSSTGVRTGLRVFDDETLGTGQVLIPGVTGSTVLNALIAHATQFHRLALLDAPLGLSPGGAKTFSVDYTGASAALYYPWVEMRDFAEPTLKKLYPPSIFAAGACAQVDRTIGTHKAPANVQIPNAIDIEPAASGLLTDTAREILNAARVNVIAPLPGQGIKIYGARVLSADPRIQMVHEIRLMNLFYHSAKRAYEWAAFSVVDGNGRLFRDLRATGAAFLRNFWRAGALYGRTEEEAFVVVADASNNPPEELNAGRVHVQWGVKLSPTAEQIIVSIDNVALFTDLSVLSDAGGRR